MTFPPAFVHAGSAAVRVTSRDGQGTTYPPDGRGRLPRRVARARDVLRGTSVVEYDELLDDARYALRSRMPQPR